jgi:hypothetical protein
MSAQVDARGSVQTRKCGGDAGKAAQKQGVKARRTRVQDQGLLIVLHFGYHGTETAEETSDKLKKVQKTAMQL